MTAAPEAESRERAALDTALKFTIGGDESCP